MLSKFYYLLISSPHPLALIRWNSSHCLLMKLFMSKEIRKEKFDSNNNWEPAWSRLSGFMKNVEFCRKISKFLPKRCLFVFCIFYLNEKELNQQVCLMKYVENEISNSTSHKKKLKKEREKAQKEIEKRERERSKNIIQLQKTF